MNSYSLRQFEGQQVRIAFGNADVATIAKLGEGINATTTYTVRGYDEAGVVVSLGTANTNDIYFIPWTLGPVLHLISGTQANTRVA